MRTTVTRWAAGCFLAGALCAGAEGEPTKTLAGNFTRGRAANPDYTLSADLTPSASNTWKVVFTCQWKGKPQTFTGTIAGDLADGEFSGDARMGGSKRAWVYRGKAAGGKLMASHFEVGKGKEQPTGEFTLAAK